MKKLIQIMLIIFIVACLSCSVCASDNPISKGPIQLVIPYGAGGSHDMVARAIVSVASDYFESSNPLVIVLKPGGNTTVGSIYVKNAKPNGHTLLFANNPNLTLFPHTQQVGFTLDDFKPVCQINHNAPVFIVNKDIGITSVEELIAKAKEKSGKLLFGSSFMGAFHVPFLLFNNKAGIDVQLMPLGGGGDALLKTISGDVDFTAGFPSTVVDHIKAGNVYPIAISSKERSEILTDVPTFFELGYEDAIFYMWRGFVVPKDTPDEIVEYLDDRFRAIVEDASFKKLISRMGETINYLNAQEFKKELEDEVERYERNLSEYIVY